MRFDAMIPKSAESKRLFGPDLIRATAILCVMLSHTIPGVTSFAMVQKIRGLLGFLGVEIFFVLSGYLIGGILLKQLQTGGLDAVSGLTLFWKRRWFRTLPNYYLFLALFLLLFLLEFGALPADAWRFFWFGQALTSAHPTFFTVAWSLAVEEWFYFAFPLILWLLKEPLGGRSSALWVSIGIFLVCPAVLRGVFWFGSWDDGLRKVTLFRLDAIMHGVVLACIQAGHSSWWKALQKAWPLGVAGIIAIALYPPRDPGIDFFDRVLRFNLTSLSIFLVFPRVADLPLPRAIIATPIQKISLWSYSMYLSHSWVGALLVYSFSAAGWSIHGVNAAVLSSLDWVGTLGISALVYSKFEKPVMDLRDRPLRSPRRVAQSGAA